jgi:hypothetical protein
MYQAHQTLLKTAGWKHAARWSARQGAFLMLLAVGASSLSGQNLPYASESDGSDGALDIPYHIQWRENFDAVYDAANGNVVLFGGNSGGTYYPQTWTMDPATGDWTLQTTATFVSGRRDHAMVYDAGNDRTILFGGFRADGTLLNDMWSFDGTDWTQLSPANAPSPRYDHAMAINPANGNILLYGGQTPAQSQETWLWDGTNWTLLTPATTPDVNHAYYHAMVYHEALGGWFLYGERQRTTWLFKDGDWTQLTTSASPDTGGRPGMAYDAANGEVVLNGGDQRRRETWLFRDNDWVLESPETELYEKYYGHALVYVPGQGAYSILGDISGFYIYSADAWSTSRTQYSTWKWDGVTWDYVSGWLYVFDMNEADADGDGKYEFTTINVPEGVQVRVVKDAANSPLEWYATGDVTIDGWVLVDGRDATANAGAGLFAAGGPGGGNGGIGGTRFDVSGSYAGTPGSGPGGGAPGVAENQFGAHGNFSDVYGNAAQQPLLGGSGGGGGGSLNSTYGGNGGGGGGAIGIYSSRDITVNGVINADGGRNDHTGGDGGDGSGGGILLVADRVLGSGSLWARGGRSRGGVDGGRIRIEAFFRPLAVNASPAPSASAPVESIAAGTSPALAIISVDGENVVIPSTGNPNSPDVVFSDAGDVTIVVQGTDIPVGTEVTLRISGTGTIITLPEAGEPAVTLDDSLQATFTTTVPAGVGTLQAFATFAP